MRYVIETKVADLPRWGRLERDDVMRRKFRQEVVDSLPPLLLSEILTFDHDPTDFNRFGFQKGLRPFSLHLSQCAFEISHITKLQVQPNEDAGLITMLETKSGLDLKTFNSIASFIQLPSLQSGFLFRLKCIVAKTDLPPPEEVKWADHNAEDEDCCCEDCYDRRGWPPREPYVYVPHIRLLVKGTIDPPRSKSRDPRGRVTEGITEVVIKDPHEGQSD